MPLKMTGTLAYEKGKNEITDCAATDDQDPVQSDQNFVNASARMIAP